MKPKSIYLLLIIVFLFLLVNLQGWGVTETSEARYAEIAREMNESGDFLHPTLLGIGHYHKPPLTYIITALSYRIFGVTSFAARFVLQIAILAQLYFVYRIGIILFKNETTALVAAAVYISFPAAIISSRALTTDAYLAVFALGAIYYWMKYRTQLNIKYLYGFYIFLAFGFLTTGPLIIIIPGIMVITYNLYNKKNLPITRHHVLAFLVFTTIAFSWFVMLMLENNAFIDYFFIRHTYERFTNAGAFKRSEPFWYYLLVLPVTSLPWFLMVVVKYVEKKKETIKINSLLFVFFMWVFPGLLFFSMSSSELILYTLPLYPGIALSAAYFLEKMNNKGLFFWNKVQLIYHVLIVVALLSLPLIIANYQFSWSVLILTIVLAVFIMGIQYVFKKSELKRILAAAVGFILLLTLITSFLFSNNQIMVNSMRPITEFIKQQHLEGYNILAYDRRLPSVAFHLQKNIVSLADGNNWLNREIQFEKDSMWKKNLLYLNQKEPMDKLKLFLKEPSVLIIKNELPENRWWLRDYFKSERRFGKWQLLYN